jgi:hypothetical protein
MPPHERNLVMTLIRRLAVTAAVVLAGVSAAVTG